MSQDDKVNKEDSKISREEAVARMKQRIDDDSRTIKSQNKEAM